MKQKRLDYEDRKVIADMYNRNARLQDIADAVNVKLGTIYQELKKGETGAIDINGRLAYDAEKAQTVFIRNLHAPRPRRKVI